MFIYEVKTIRVKCLLDCETVYFLFLNPPLNSRPGSSPITRVETNVPGPPEERVVVVGTL